jgi:hypothetical protein
MENAAFLATAVGLTLGMYIGLSLTKRLSNWISELTRAPRLVQCCSISGAFLFLVLSVPISVFVGGMLGGGWGEELSIAVGYGSLGVPVGLSLGIAILLICGIVIGALVGGTVGKLLSHFLPEAVLTWRSKKDSFQIKDASVRGGNLLISEPTKWQKLENKHLASSLVIPAKAGIHDSRDRFPPSRE